LHVLSNVHTVLFGRTDKLGCTLKGHIMSAKENVYPMKPQSNAAVCYYSLSNIVMVMVNWEMV